MAIRALCSSLNLIASIIANNLMAAASRSLNGVEECGSTASNVVWYYLKAVSLAELAERAAPTVFDIGINMGIWLARHKR